MSNLLDWYEAEKKHCASLQVFTCTTSPEKNVHTRWKRYHPRPWEYRVQSWVRRLHPPLKNERQLLLLGFDADGLAAVALIEEVGDAAVIEVSVMAIALRLRYKGGGYADEMVQRTLEAVHERAIAQGVKDVLLYAHVHEKNEASQKLCRRLGMAHTDMVDDELQYWCGTWPIEVIDETAPAPSP